MLAVPLRYRQRTGRASTTTLMYRCTIAIAIVIAGVTITRMDAQLPSAVRTVSPIDGLRDTTQGVHFGLPFNAHAAIVHEVRVEAPAGFTVDYVWGASPTGGPNVPGNTGAWHETYTPWRRESPGLHWLQQNHPDWIMYRWDRKTIAYADPSLPGLPDVDTTNPAYQQWFLQNFALPALRKGFQGISFDNGLTANIGQDAGHFDTHGRWVQQYSGRILNDQAYATAQAAAFAAIARATHAAFPRATITVNGGYNTYTTPTIWNASIPFLDMVSDEYAFNNGGSGYLASNPGGVGVSNRWLTEMQRYEQLQKDEGKGLWFINTLGYAVLPYMTDSDSRARADVAWVLANYLLIKYNHTYLAIVGDHHYGYPLIPQHEYTTVQQIGAPSGDFFAGQGVYMRNYTGGLALVNPSSTATFTVNVLPDRYTDLYGNVVHSPVSLGPHTGAVLLFRCSPGTQATPQAHPSGQQCGAASRSGTPIPVLRGL